MADFPYTIDDVLMLLGISHNNNRNIRVKCPKCGRKDFTVNRENEKFSCYHCELRGRSGTSLYSSIHNVDSSTAYKEITKALNCGNTTRKVSAPIVVNEETKLADIKVRHFCNSCILSNCTLSDRDRNDLLKRGFLDEEIKKLGYKSAIENNDNRIFDIPKQLQKRGISLVGVPPFFKAKSKDLWIMSTWKGGIYVPYRNRNALIQGFQLRKHNEELGADEEKYCWVSSVNKHCGTSSKSYIHYACDFEMNKESKEYQPILNGDSILLTEGAMKGDLFHAITGFPAICVAGVNSLSELDDELVYLKERGIKYILIGYDMDYETKPQVARAVESLKAKIESHGLSWQRILWNSTYKGIDDYYAFKYRNIK